MRAKILILTIVIFICLFFCIQIPSLAQNQTRNYEIDDLIKVVRLSNKAIVIRTGVTYFDVVAAIATEKGIVVIDAGNTPQLTEKYKKIITKEFGRDDFAYLINTHSHRDHTGGNQVFSNVKIIGHERSKEAMIRDWNDPLYREMLQNGIKERTERLKNLDINTDAGKQAYFSLIIYSMAQTDIDNGKHITTAPSITFKDNMTLSLGDITVEMMYFGNAHSEGDTFIYIPEEKLLFNGDVFFSGGTPNLTYFATEETSGSNEVKRWQKVLSHLLKSDRPVETIVRGHGDIMNLNDLKTFNQSIEDIRTKFESGKDIYPLGRINNILEKEGISGARTELQKLLTVDKDKYFFVERGFNVILNNWPLQNKSAEAIEIYKTNIALFPESWNVYDRLADAYLKSGNKGLAIETYEKSIKINPNNTSGIEALQQLKSK